MTCLVSILAQSSAVQTSPFCFLSPLTIASILSAPSLPHACVSQAYESFLARETARVDALAEAHTTHNTHMKHIHRVHAHSHALHTSHSISRSTCSLVALDELQQCAVPMCSSIMTMVFQAKRRGYVLAAFDAEVHVDTSGSGCGGGGGSSRNALDL